MRSLRTAIPAGLAAALGLVASCRPAAEPVGTGRGVLLICVAELRADHLSANGYDRPTTPELDQLSRAGVAFSDVWSTAPWSLPACASLLTGCDPYVARRILPAGIPATLATRWNIPRAAPRLAQEFLRAGWSTAAFLDDPTLAPVHGFSFGFTNFVMDHGPSAEVEGLAGVPARLVGWLQTLEHDQDWFAFAQLDYLERIWERGDPALDSGFEARPELSQVPPVGDAEHLFHAIPRRRWSGGVHTLGEYEAHYDGALRRLDAHLGRLLDELERMGRLRDTTVCVVGSHGLGFGEAGLFLDHGTLSEADLRVPWILKPAAALGIAPGQSVDALASLLDVGPTLLELSGLGTPGSMHGVSFAALLRGGGRPPRDFAVARCAFQDGYVVVEPGWRLELTRPWVVDEEILASSWYGAPPPYEERPREVLEQRSGAPVDEPRAAAERRRLCELGARWVQEMERLRRSLQSVDWLLSTGLEVESDVVVLGPCAPLGSAAEGER